MNTWPKSARFPIFAITLPKFPGEPFFLTRHGYGDMVVMSIDQFEAFRKGQRFDATLREAQKVALDNPTRYNFDEVSSNLRKKLMAKVDETDA